MERERETETMRRAQVKLRPAQATRPDDQLPVILVRALIQSL